MTNGCLITRSTILYLLLISAQLCYRSNGKSLHNSKPVFCPKFRLTWPVYNTRFLHDPCLTSSSIRHLGRTITIKGYYNRRLNYYPNSSSSYQAIRIRVSGDVSLNPGPDKCIKCRGQRSSWREEAKFLVRLYFGLFLAFLCTYWHVQVAKMHTSD